MKILALLLLVVIVAVVLLVIRSRAKRKARQAKPVSTGSGLQYRTSAYEYPRSVPKLDSYKTSPNAEYSRPVARPAPTRTKPIVERKREREDDNVQVFVADDSYVSYTEPTTSYYDAPAYSEPERSTYEAPTYEAPSSSSSDYSSGSSDYGSSSSSYDSGSSSSSDY